MCGPRIDIAIVCSTEPNTLCAKPPFVFFSKVEVAPARTSGLVNLVLSRQTGFFRVRTDGHKRSRCSKYTVVRHGFETIYPSNMPRMLNKDLTRSMQNQSGSEQAKKKALLTGCSPNKRA